MVRRVVSIRQFHGAASHELIHGGPGASPHHASNSVLAESSLDLGKRNTVFVRAERVQKNGEELGFQGGDLTTLPGQQRAVLAYNHSDDYLATVLSLEAKYAASANIVVPAVPTGTTTLPVPPPLPPANPGTPPVLVPSPQPDASPSTSGRKTPHPQTE